MYSVFAELLQKTGITTYRVAKQTGIAQSTFSDWKNGKSVPGADKLGKIADYFDCSVDYLMGRVAHPHDTLQNLAVLNDMIEQTKIPPTPNGAGEGLPDYAIRFLRLPEDQRKLIENQIEMFERLNRESSK